MVPQLRDKFNAEFSESRYNLMVEEIKALHPGALDFRNSETPVFIPKAFTNMMLDACEGILDIITDKDFLKVTDRSIPRNLRVPGTESRPEFICFDFGICKDKNGAPEPQLIEMQAFPSLFAYQEVYSDIMRRYSNLPENYSSYLNGFNTDTHHALLKEIILGNHKPENVILLEIFPEQQKTRIDFYCTEAAVGIKTVCLTDLITEGKELYYKLNGKKTRINRIFNRLIFDDLQHQPGWEKMPDLTREYDVEWAPHPNWFYRLSKFTLPYLINPYVPETYFLNEIKQPPALEDFVLKPLFSFAGMGVVIDVTHEILDRIPDPENWILQRKVEYIPIIKTLDEPAKAEIRLFYYWKKDWERPRAVHNLSRLSKGKMIGTRYNKDKTWVGGTIAFFEQ
ncbi:MAG: hypothetical protein KF829_01540 [Ferruginibacter sp.]|nr:hypothetical protein [Ferruginibacter sp.]